MRIDINKNRSVWVARYTQRYTYEGLIQGKPNERLNRSILEDITAPKGWGDRSFYLKPCTINEIKTALPEVIHYVWLESDPLNEEYFGSDLIYAWLSDQQPDMALIAVIKEGLNGLDWKSKAMDYLL